MQPNHYHSLKYIIKIILMNDFMQPDGRGNFIPSPPNYGPHNQEGKNELRENINTIDYYIPIQLYWGVG